MSETYYLEKLKAIAPGVVFTVSRTPDQDAKWDGDGPDPIDRGFYPYVVDVEASIIVAGRLECRASHLGDSYYQADEPLGNIHGYLPQMLEESVFDLLALHPAHQDLLAAREYLIEVLKQEWEKQQVAK